MASTAPQELQATELYNRLQGEQQVVTDFWVHIDSSSPLEKYPAKQHAQRVAQKLKVSKGLIYLPGAPTELEEDSDQPKPFRQRRYFYYLSGVNETDCHLAYDIDEDTLTLFIPKIDPTTVIWNGRGSTRAEAFDKYDVDEVHFTTSVADFVGNWPLSHEGDVYILHPDQAAVPGQEKHPRVDHKKLQLAINSARMIKDAHEIGLIRKANEITAKAHREVLLNILKFKNESQVEAIFLDACVAEGAKHQAYDVIAASGLNASTLHYIKNDEPLKGRQMMCLDAGCEWECYASDVTRSFPLSGSWPSKEAKQIHDLVQTMQDCCIKRLAPGVRYLDLHILAHQIAIGGLLALGILYNGSPEEIYRAGTSRAFFPHGLGHHIGLEVHDIGQRELMSLSEDETFDPNNVQASSKYSPNYHLPVFHSGLCLSPTDPQSPALEEGMIVTVEPGIYFSLYALETLYLPSPVHSKYINKEVLSRYIPVGGVRIEDDILITAKGYQNLTTALKGEEMLNIIKSEGKHNVPEKDASIATTAPVILLEKSSLETFVEPSQLSLSVQEPAPRRIKRTAGACRYCRTRMLRCSPVDQGRCTNCIRFGLEECIMIPSKARKVAPVEASEVIADLEWCTGPTLFADFQIPATAHFRPQATAPAEKPEGLSPASHTREQMHQDKPSSLLTQHSATKPRISRLLGSQKPASSWEESILSAHPSNQPWDGMDALGFAVDHIADVAQTPPQVPRKPLAYRHSVPCFSETPDMKAAFSAGATSREVPETSVPLSDSPSPLRSRPSSSRQSPALLTGQKTSTIGQERLSKVRDHLFRPQDVPETWGSMRARMNQDPPAVPQWVCSELEQLRQTYPSSNIAPVMVFSAIDAKSSVVLQLKPDLPAPAHPGVLYTYLPRIRCVDCPGKLYTPPMANFEIHLKNRFHKAAVAKNREAGMQPRTR